MSYSILYLNRVSQIGGAAQSLSSLLQKLDRDRFRPTVVLPSAGPLADRFEGLGVETVFVPLNRLRWRNPRPYLGTLRSLLSLQRMRKFDLVHANIGFCNQYASVAAKLTRTPCICHVRNIETRVSFWEHALWLADVLIANSQATMDSIRGLVRKAQRLELVYNGVDLERFSPHCDGWFRGQMGLDRDAFVVGMVGRITPEKGQHTFIRGLSTVVSQQPKVRGLIVGDVVIDGTQGYLSELKRMVAESGLSGKVFFAGFVDDMPGVYDALDLLVSCSTAEPFGRVLIEAMAMEKPVIASRAGGAVEVVDDAVTGLLVPPERPEPLAEAILQLADDKALGRRMGLAGRERTQALFSGERTMARIERIYQEMLGL